MTTAESMSAILRDLRVLQDRVQLLRDSEADPVVATRLSFMCSDLIYAMADGERVIQVAECQPVSSLSRRPA